MFDQMLVVPSSVGVHNAPLLSGTSYLFGGTGGLRKWVTELIMWPIGVMQNLNYYLLKIQPPKKYSSSLYE